MSMASLLPETSSKRFVAKEGLAQRLFKPRFRIVDTDWVFAAVVVVYAPSLVFSTILNTVFAVVIYSDPFGAKISTLYNFLLFWIVALLCRNRNLVLIHLTSAMRWFGLLLYLGLFVRTGVSIRSEGAACAGVFSCWSLDWSGFNIVMFMAGVIVFAATGVCRQVIYNESINLTDLDDYSATANDLVEEGPDISLILADTE